MSRLSNNLTLLPASLLRYKRRWRAVANGLTAGTVLIILPDDRNPQRATLERLAVRMRDRGHQVVTLLAAELI